MAGASQQARKLARNDSVQSAKSDTELVPRSGLVDSARGSHGGSPSPAGSPRGDPPVTVAGNRLSEQALTATLQNDPLGLNLSFHLPGPPSEAEVSRHVDRRLSRLSSMGTVVNNTPEDFMKSMDTEKSAEYAPRGIREWVMDHLCIVYTLVSILVIMGVSVGLAVPLAMCEINLAATEGQCPVFMPPPVDYDGSVPRLLVRFLSDVDAIRELPPHLREAVNHNPEFSFKLESNLQVVDFQGPDGGCESSWDKFRAAFEYLAHTHGAVLDTLIVDHLMAPVHANNGTRGDALGGLQFPMFGRAGERRRLLAPFQYGTGAFADAVPTDLWWMVGGQDADPFLNEFRDKWGNDHIVEFDDVNPFPAANHMYVPHKTYQIYTTGAINAWNRMGGSLGNPDVVVGVIDTGIDIAHEDLFANIYTNPGEIPGNGIDDDGNGKIDDVHGWDFGDHDNDPSDPDGHGTHCAGVIAMSAGNGKGGVGIAPNVKIMPLKVLDAMGNMYFSAGYAAMQYAKLMGAHILSNSYATPYADHFDPLEINPSSPRNPEWLDSVYFTGSFTTEIGKLEKAGILFVAAGGNSHTNNTRLDEYDYHFLPGNVDKPNVLTVGWMMENNKKIAPMSSYGANADRNMYGRNAQVHLGAPGQEMHSTIPTAMGLYGTKSGSSQSTPVAAGVAALVLSALCHHTADPACLAGKAVEVRRIMCETSSELDLSTGSNGTPKALTYDFITPGINTEGPFFTCGAVDADAAVALALEESAVVGGLSSPIVDVHPEDLDALMVSNDLVSNLPVRMEVYDISAEMGGPDGGAESVSDLGDAVWDDPALRFMTSALLDYPPCDPAAAGVCNGIVTDGLAADLPELANTDAFDLAMGHAYRFTTHMAVTDISKFGTYWFCVQLGAEDSAQVTIGGVDVGTVETTAADGPAGTELSECLALIPVYVYQLGYLPIEVKYMQTTPDTPQGLVIKCKKSLDDEYAPLGSDGFVGVIPRSLGGAGVYAGIAVGTYTDIVSGSLIAAVEDAMVSQGTYTAVGDARAWEPVIRSASSLLGGLTHYEWQAAVSESYEIELVTLEGVACELFVGGMSVGAIGADGGTLDVTIVGTGSMNEFDLWCLNSSPDERSLAFSAGGAPIWSSSVVNGRLPVPLESVVTESVPPAGAYKAGIAVATTYQGWGSTFRKNRRKEALGFTTVSTLGSAQDMGTTSTKKNWEKLTHSFDATLRRIAADASGTMREAVAVRFQADPGWSAPKVAAKMWLLKADGTWWSAAHNYDIFVTFAEVGGLPNDWIAWRARYVSHHRCDVVAELCFEEDPATTDCVAISADNAIAPIRENQFAPPKEGWRCSTLQKNPSSKWTEISSGFMGQYWATPLRWRPSNSRGVVAYGSGRLDGTQFARLMVTSLSRDDICMITGSFKAAAAGWYTFRAVGLDGLSGMGGVNVQLQVGGSWGWNNPEVDDWTDNYMLQPTIYRDDADGYGRTTFNNAPTRTAEPVYLAPGSYEFVFTSAFPSGLPYTCAHNLEVAMSESSNAVFASGDFEKVVLYGAWY